jgi:hypothetical protein
MRDSSSRPALDELSASASPDSSGFHLAKLDLRSCQLSDASMARILKLLVDNHVGVDRLCLSGNRMGEKCEEAI